MKSFRLHLENRKYNKFEFSLFTTVLELILLLHKVKTFSNKIKCENRMVYTYRFCCNSIQTFLHIAHTTLVSKMSYTSPHIHPKFHKTHFLVVENPFVTRWWNYFWYKNSERNIKNYFARTQNFLATRHNNSPVKVNY